jgi:DNA helicase IV
MAKRSFYVRESELDDFQRKVIAKRTDSSFIVKGCAGSGKSILALWKAHDIQQKNKGSVQMIVYTKALKTYMETAMKDIGINPDIVDYHWNWENRNTRQTKYLIVDEVQDFSEADIKKFLQYAEIIILYGDSAQQIYSFRRANPPINIEEIEWFTGFPSEQLVFNHRLPKTVARVAQYVSNTPDVLEYRCKNEGAEKPVFLKYGSLDEQLDALTEIIENRDFEDVGILLPSNSSVKYAAKYLQDNDLDVEAKTSETMDLNWDSSNPKLMTYWSAKGVQFEAVFLPVCDTIRDSSQKPLYVAMTRTYQSLYVMYSGHLPPMFADIPSDLYETSLMTRETELL